MTCRPLLTLLILGLLLLTANVALAQTGGPTLTLVSLDDSNFPTLTLRLNIVDPTGRPVAGLSAAAVEVLEDGAPAEVVSVRDVSDTQQAIAVVLVIDVSDSMAGTPLAAAKESAISFVKSLGAGDQVAVLAFGSTVREAQPFTTNKAQAQAAIESLQLSGATALYDAANQGVLTAARSPLARRIVILLGDGAEYGGASLSAREDAYQAARANGVTIHTIAFGFNADTDYFQQLSGLTGGAALTAPTPAELDTRWQEIAALLRQLVEVVVKSKAPGDGQTHTLTVRVKAGGGQAEATGAFKSKSVAPTVTVNGLAPAAVLQEATTLAANVAAQGEVASVTFKLDGDLLMRDTESPWTAELDPAALAPGAHTLGVEAVDQTGATGSTEIAFQVASLPPKVSLSLAEGVKLDAPLSITPNIVSQSEANEVTVAVDGAPVETLNAEPYRFTLDPADFSAGAHTLTVTVKDANGQPAAAEVGFTVVKSVSTAAVSIWIIIGLGVILLAIVGAVFVFVALRGRRQPAAAPAPPTGFRLEVRSGPDKGKVLAITNEKQVIGRLSAAPLMLNDPTGGLHLSREHAQVWKSGNVVYIEDNGSRYGTYVNGVKISGPALLANGAQIKLGEVELSYQAPAAAPAAAGDLRATRLDAGAFPTMLGADIDESTYQPPAVEQLDKTMLAEEEDAPARRTRLKAEAQPEAAETKVAAPSSDAVATEPPPPEIEPPADEEDEIRHTRLKPAPPPEDEDEMRRTQLLKKKADEEDDEPRQTRLKG